MKFCFRISNNVPHAEPDGANDQLMALISYIGFLFVIPLLMKNQSEYVHFHVNQGMILFVFIVLVRIFSHVPGIGECIAFLGDLFFSFFSWLEFSMPGRERQLVSLL